jgi:hypothetical protein
VKNSARRRRVELDTSNRDILNRPERSPILAAPRRCRVSRLGVAVRRDRFNTTSAGGAARSWTPVIATRGRSVDARAGGDAPRGPVSGSIPRVRSAPLLPAPLHALKGRDDEYRGQ